jgi:hypothetical protein
VVFFHHIPAIQWIAPKLTVFAKIVRWDASDFSGTAPFIEEKKFRMTPYISTGMGDINRHVPDDLDTPGIGVGLKCRPLSVISILQKALKTDFFMIAMSGQSKGVGRASDQILIIPLGPVFF